MLRIAVISVHGCPVLRSGEKDTGGMNVYLLELAKKLGQLGLMVDVYTRYHDPQDPQVIQLGQNTRVIHIYAGPYGEPKGSIYHDLPQFVRNLQSFQRSHGLSYDVVHSHYWLSGWVGNILSREWGVPHITHFHTLAEVKRRARVGEREPALRSTVERQVVQEAHRIVAGTPHERDALVRFYGAQPGKIVVIPCGVDTKRFRPMDQEEARTHLGLNGAHVVLYVGRIEPLKGVELLLRCIAGVEHNSEYKLLVVGGRLHRDRQLAQLRTLAQELGIGEKVNFLGSLPQEELPYYYNAADVCVVPSYYESFGLVALEAMACGTPVIARRVGGLLNLVRDGYTGYLIPWHCPDPFAERLEVLLASNSLRKAMGRAAHSWAQQWSWDLVATQVEEAYQELLTAPLALAAGE